MTAEAKVLELRQVARNGQKGLLRERVAQLNQEISGSQAQEKGKAKELILIQRETRGCARVVGERPHAGH